MSCKCLPRPCAAAPAPALDAEDSLAVSDVTADAAPGGICADDDDDGADDSGAGIDTEDVL